MAGKYPGWSPYNYVLNNPLRLIDPTGMAPEDDEEEGLWGWLSGLFGTSSSNDNPGTQMTESIVGGVNNQVNSAVDNMGNAINALPGKMVDATIQVADAVSDGATIGAATGVLVTLAGAVHGNPIVAGAGAKITSTSLSIGMTSDAVSFGAKGTNALFFGGSKNAVGVQAIKLGGNFLAGRLLNSAASKVVTRTGLSNVLFKGSTGFVKNSFGFTTEAVRDATKIAIGLGL